MRKYLLIILFALVLFICPRVNAMTSSGNASVGRSAVMDSSYNYYYTDWKSLSSNSINGVPVPYSGGNYYHMGSEYAYAITLNGETNFNVHVRIPVVADTIYNYQLMNGLNENDYKLGIDQNFSVYNIHGFSNWQYAWECQTYTHLLINHNYCYYDADLSFTLDQPLTGAYNLNFAVLNTTGNRSAYYYSGTDSSGNAIEFPVSAQNSGYANLAPTVSISATSGGSSSTGNEEILEGISSSTEALQNTIQESYENLVKSQEVCTNTESVFNSSSSGVSSGFINSSGSVSSSINYFHTDYVRVSSNPISIKYSSGSTSPSACLYDIDKNLIQCYSYSSGSNLTLYIPATENAYYIRASLLKETSSTITTNYCQNGNQALYDFMNEPFDGSGIGADITDVQWYENSYFSSLITSPIVFLSSLSESCSPITLTLFNHDVTLPCGTTIFWERDSSYIQNFRTFWNILFAGLIIYRLALQLILTVNDCLDPTKDSVGGFKI